jgi:hypothetical protein
MRASRNLSREWPDEISTSSRKILDILHYTLKRLASFGPRELGLITGRWRLRTERISSGCGLALMMSTSESSNNRANYRLEADAQKSRAAQASVSPHRMECFLAVFIPGTIGRCGGIEP